MIKNKYVQVNINVPHAMDMDIFNMEVLKEILLENAKIVMEQEKDKFVFHV